MSATAAATVERKPRATRKLKVVNVVEAAPIAAPEPDLIVEQLIRSTSAPISNFTADLVVENNTPVIETPAKPKRTYNRKPKTDDDVAEPAPENKPKTTRKTKTDDDIDVAEPEPENKPKRTYNRKPKTDDDDDVAPENKPKTTKTKTDEEPENKPKRSYNRKPKNTTATTIEPTHDPFTHSPSIIPSPTHDDIEVEECAINGILYYKDNNGLLYDHTTFKPINM